MLLVDSWRRCQRPRCDPGQAAAAGAPGLAQRRPPRGGLGGAARRRGEAGAAAGDCADARAGGRRRGRARPRPWPRVRRWVQPLTAGAMPLATKFITCTFHSVSFCAADLCKWMLGRSDHLAQVSCWVSWRTWRRSRSSSRHALRSSAATPAKSKCWQTRCRRAACSSGDQMGVADLQRSAARLWRRERGRVGCEASAGRAHNRRVMPAPPLPSAPPCAEDSWACRARSWNYY